MQKSSWVSSAFSSKLQNSVPLLLSVLYTRHSSRPDISMPPVQFSYDLIVAYIRLVTSTVETNKDIRHFFGKIVNDIHGWDFTWKTPLQNSGWEALVVWQKERIFASGNTFIFNFLHKYISGWLSFPLEKNHFGFLYVLHLMILWARNNGLIALSILLALGTNFIFLGNFNSKKIFKWLKMIFCFMK